MNSKTEEFKPIRWWVFTSKGGRTLKSMYNPAKDGQVKYQILHGEQRHLDNRSKNYFWIECFKVFDSFGRECELNENGITAKLTLYDSTLRKLYCYMTDVKGQSKPVSFNGDISAISKCINYMQILSQSTSWMEFEWKEQKQLIQKQKDEILQLKLQVKELRATLDKYKKEDNLS